MEHCFRELNHGLIWWHFLQFVLQRFSTDATAFGGFEINFLRTTFKEIPSQWSSKNASGIFCKFCIRYQHVQDVIRTFLTRPELVQNSSRIRPEFVIVILPITNFQVTCWNRHLRMDNDLLPTNERPQNEWPTCLLQFTHRYDFCACSKIFSVLDLGWRSPTNPQRPLNDPWTCS